MPGALMNRLVLRLLALFAALIVLGSCSKPAEMHKKTEEKLMSDWIETLVVGSLGVNCLVIDCGNGDGIVVDPGAESGRVIDAVKRRKLNIVQVINTHGHF